MQKSVRALPVNQTLRINILRGAFLAGLPLILFSQPQWHAALYETIEILGLALVFSAVLGRFWAILYIGSHKNRAVMQDGPYSICRHPLYFFSTLGVFGFGLLLGSLVISVVLGGITLAILTLTARKEEAFLRGSFGAAHEAYAARVPMILPRPALFRSADTITVSVSHLRRNLLDALVFLGFIPLAEVLEYMKKLNVLPGFPIY